MFIYYLSGGVLWASLNVFWWSSRIYATTGRMLFFLLCRIISEHYINIRKEIEMLKSRISLDVGLVSDRLTKLSHQHLSVCQCVDNLNQIFGLILLFEITCIFINEIIQTVYLLVALHIHSSDWLSISIILFWDTYFLVSFSIICSASYRIRNEVKKIIKLFTFLKINTSFISFIYTGK